MQAGVALGMEDDGRDHPLRITQPKKRAGRALSRGEGGEGGRKIARRPAGQARLHSDRRIEIGVGLPQEGDSRSAGQEDRRALAPELPGADDLMMRVYAAMARKERELIAERTRSALAAVRARGARLGGDREYRPVGGPPQSDPHPRIVQAAPHGIEDSRGLLTPPDHAADSSDRAASGTRRPDCQSVLWRAAVALRRRWSTKLRATRGRLSRSRSMIQIFGCAQGSSSGMKRRP